MKIFLCDLNHDCRVNHFCAPLNIGFISAYLTSRFGDEVDIRLFKSPTELVGILKGGDIPDVIGFSNYSWNQELNRFFETRIGQEHPNVVIVQGGPHIRIDRDGIKKHLLDHNFVDYYAMFEGEFSMGELIGSFLSNERALKPSEIGGSIKGVAFLDGDLVFEHRDTEKGELSNIPSPYLTGVLDEFISSPMYLPILETNRGCPFACTFCAWGVNVLNKVRRFDLDRIIAEIKYVAARSPATQWYFSDANFGMFERDVEIAKALREAADSNPNLRGFAINWAKNSSKYCTEIAHILKGVCDPLVAVQSTDPIVLKHIKRDNIRMSTITDLVEQGRRDGIAMTTDVLVGLSGETFESHLNTLRQVFAIGFESFNVGPIRLLPGSEMESDADRERFGIQSRFRLIDGFFGVYDNTPVVEYEESVVATNTLSRDEMVSIRIIHFLTWAYWNSGLAQPLLRYMYLADGVNPLDGILTLTTEDVSPEIANFFAEYKSEILTEWFDTPEELMDYAKNNMEDLTKVGYRKYNIKYLAKLFLNSDLSRLMLRTIASHSKSPVAEELAEFSFERTVFFDNFVCKKTRSFSPKLLDAIKLIYPDYASADSHTCKFWIDEKKERAIQADLQRFGFAEEAVRALALSMQNFGTKMFYNFSFGAGHALEETYFPDSFDYDNQVSDYRRHEARNLNSVSES